MKMESRQHQRDHTFRQRKDNDKERQKERHKSEEEYNKTKENLQIKKQKTTEQVIGAKGDNKSGKNVQKWIKTSKRNNWFCIKVEKDKKKKY